MRVVRSFYLAFFALLTISGCSSKSGNAGSSSSSAPETNDAGAGAGGGHSSSHGGGGESTEGQGDSGDDDASADSGTSFAVDAGDAGEMDAGVPPEAGPPQYDALPPMPEVVNADGGVLASPQIIAIFFQNDPDATTYESFYMGLCASAYWQVEAEYGVGACSVQIVTIAEDAPTSVNDGTTDSSGYTPLQEWLLSEITSGTLPAPGTQNNNLMYAINYPLGTTVNAGSFTVCKDGYGGYHSDIQDGNGNNIAYSMDPICPPYGSETTEQTQTATISHEILEGSADPWAGYQPAWSQVNNAFEFFTVANDGSEIADMCENDPEADYTFSDFPFMVQRIWSNASALAGHDPCVPEIPGTVFFNAVPELPDTGTLDYNGTNFTVSSVNIPLGGTATVYIDLYSDGPIADWDVNVYDWSTLTGMATLLDIEQPVTSGNNGSRIPVTITVKQAGNMSSNGTPNNTEIFQIWSSQGAIYDSQGNMTDVPAHLWYGVVTN